MLLRLQGVSGGLKETLQMWAALLVGIMPRKFACIRQLLRPISRRHFFCWLTHGPYYWWQLSCKEDRGERAE